VCVHKNRFSEKLSNLELWSLLTIGNPTWYFKEPIIGPLKFKMAEIRHLENCDIAILNEKSPDFDEIWYTIAD